MAEPARNDDGLPRLFGYAALERIYGWKRRTLENAVNAGKLRKPFYVGKVAHWYARDIDDYLGRLRGDLEDLAVSSPDKIAPENIEPALGVLAARLATARGIDLPPGSFVSVNAPVTADQLAQHVSAANDQLAAAFAQLDINRACLVVGGLMPVLRPVTDRVLLNNTGIANAFTDEDLRALAIDIIDQALGGEFVGPQS